MSWIRWAIALLLLLTAGWMLLDGTRALIVGDYVTPTSGEYAGQLGPWSKLVQRFGIEPRSLLMKSIFVAYGLLAFIGLACYLIGYSWARGLLIVICILGVWYLPLGTITNLLILILLFVHRS